MQADTANIQWYSPKAAGLSPAPAGPGRRGRSQSRQSARSQTQTWPDGQQTPASGSA